MSEFCLSLDPYLENSTLWWIDTFCPEGSIRRLDTPDKGQQLLRDDYHQWMSEQGVIIKDPKRYVLYDDHGLNFVDEQSMLIFVLRWGN
jgi:hypothetical protein